MTLHQPTILESEFASIRVEVDHRANGPRLRLTDLRSGRVAYLDPLQLETVLWFSDELWNRLLDPGSDRWREPVES
ncbi:hypothetical protein [Granulicoccus phenolivorans]|uniref:hypothetical protein n=1 Tax=Granulicoccus phenolivorans TaxID=266854 RepID=UPI00041E0987|nr:hypothetical protein [Granulicoccus phenolivorans]